MAGLLIPPELFFLDMTGKPLHGGSLYTFIPGTSTDKPTWQDAAATIANTNPIILGERGECICFGDGDFRLVVTDADGNQILDALASEPLPANTISSVMLPIVGALSLQQARDLLGVSQAINDAISNVSMLAGPTGPTGPQGIQGPVGPQGIQGVSAAVAQYLHANPGYWIDGDTGFLLNFGSGATDGRGHATQNFARPYMQNCFGVLATSATAWANVSGITNTGFTVDTKSPIAGGDWSFGPIGFWFLAFGK